MSGSAHPHTRRAPQPARAHRPPPQPIGGRQPPPPADRRQCAPALRPAQATIVEKLLRAGADLSGEYGGKDTSEWYGDSLSELAHDVRGYASDVSGNGGMFTDDWGGGGGVRSDDAPGDGVIDRGGVRGAISDDEAALLATARGLAAWHRSFRFEAGVEIITCTPAGRRTRTGAPASRERSRR